MLFNSYLFLFCFLPLCIFCFRIASVAGSSRMAICLLVFSLIFYGSWDPSALLLLLAMVCINYGLAQMLVQLANDPRRKWLLTLGIIINLLPLIYFKYSGFLLTNIAYCLDLKLDFVSPSLPAGISFYTFIQIAWLVSVARGVNNPEGLTRHMVFSTAFPYILSGPIVRYEQLGPELDNLRAPTANMLALGFSLFSVGLAKKVLLADSLAPYANAVFNAAEKAWPITGTEAWLGSLTYSFQLYFDFSGYTDMAIAIGLMLGLRLPENFISPYKSTGIVDFWRRWHITLGLWLRDFLYIPLGGNRKGKWRQYRNLFLTMLIGGAWHGAGWTFIIWGALHGLMLTVNHFFRAITRDTKASVWLASLPVRVISIAITFFCLNFCWVIFRTPTLEGALNMYGAMFSGSLQSPGALGTLAGYLPNHYFNDVFGLIILGVSAVIIFALPSSHEIFSQREDAPKPWLHFRYTKTWAALAAFLFFAALLFISRKSAFLYFQF
ncbi:MAG: MBOAT family protein [Desulfovibrionaceae bacterium]|nr:MBOAT family protein [Desulfovibrionaceae bacterium]